MLKQFLPICVLTIALTTAFVTSTNAQTSRLYFAGYAGLFGMDALAFTESGGTNGELNLNNGQAFAGALGLRISERLRVEAELSFSGNDMNNIVISNNGRSSIGGEFKSMLTMMNMYYDFDTQWPVQPFMSAGLGLGFHDFSIDDGGGPAADISDSTTSINWQIGGGLKYRVSPDLAFTGAYRYIDGMELDFGPYSLDQSAHEFRAGFEYDLPIR